MLTHRQYLQARVHALQQRITAWKVSALLLTNPRDIYYLTGFTGEDSWALVPRNNLRSPRNSRPARVHILSDFRFQEELAHVAPQAVRHIRKGLLSAELQKVARQLRLRKLALQSDYLTLAQRKKIAGVLGAANLRDVDDGLLQQRSVKDAGEVAAIRRALAIQQQAFRKMRAWLKPGRTEYEVAAYLDYQMRLLGAEGSSFPTIIAADANASLPHAVPGPRKIRAGGTVLIDWGARYRGYCGDLTRVLALGSMPAKIREIYRIVLEAQLAGIAAIAPGKALQEVDAAARKIIKKAGYAQHFGHGLGHGIGLNIHEQPVLAPQAKGVLEPGQIVTVEPGIYLPGIGGVRIEDDILVTANGATVLSDLPKDLASAVV